MDKFLIVGASNFGPVFFGAQTLERMTALLMAFHQRKLGDATATLWAKKRGRWVPMFEHQHAA